MAPGGHCPPVLWAARQQGVWLRPTLTREVSFSHFHTLVRSKPRGVSEIDVRPILRAFGGRSSGKLIPLIGNHCT